MEYMDLCYVARGWTVREERGAIECRILFIKEEVSDEVVKIDLTYAFPKGLE